MIKYKYKIIEYEYTKMTDKEVEVCKTLHKTNNILFYYLLIILFKIKGIKYQATKEK